MHKNKLSIYLGNCEPGHYGILVNFNRNTSINRSPSLALAVRSLLLNLLGGHEREELARGEVEIFYV